MNRRDFLVGVTATSLTKNCASASDRPTYKDCDSLLWIIATNVPPHESGLMSLNRDGWKEHGAQRAIPRFLGGAIMQEDPDKVEAGLKGLAKTFTYQDMENGFPYIFGSKHSVEGYVSGRYLTEAFFLVELLQTFHICRSTGFGKRYSKRIEYYIDQMKTASAKIFDHLDSLIVENIAAANRVTLLLRFAVLANAAYDFDRPVGTYFHAVSSLETNEGFFLESGGHDVSYNAAAIMFGAYTLFVEQNDLFAHRLAKSLQWLSSKIDTDGGLLTSDDTRTSGQEAYDGHVKGPNFGEISSSLVLGSVLTKNTNYLSQARKVWKKMAVK